MRRSLMPCNRATYKRLLSILAGYFTGKNLNEPHWEFWLNGNIVCRSNLYGCRRFPFPPLGAVCVWSPTRHRPNETALAW
jgi:hypothetical protein